MIYLSSEKQFQLKISSPPRIPTRSCHCTLLERQPQSGGGMLDYTCHLRRGQKIILHGPAKGFLSLLPFRWQWRYRAPPPEQPRDALKAHVLLKYRQDWLRLLAGVHPFKGVLPRWGLISYGSPGATESQQPHMSERKKKRLVKVGSLPTPLVTGWAFGWSKKALKLLKLLSTSYNLCFLRSALHTASSFPSPSRVCVFARCGF